ncbi:MAG: hypothetical protein AAFY70_17205, partial [Bacteroidota bacterium]
DVDGAQYFIIRRDRLKSGDDLSFFSGDICISKERKVVTGVIITDKEEKILGKQFFRKYDMTLPLPFPQELIQITYRKGKAYYRITTFENIQYNVRDDEEWYAYPMPTTVGGTE